MLRWYLSRTPHFYSDWLWPYCDLLYFKNVDQYTLQIFTTEFLSWCCPTFFFTLRFLMYVCTYWILFWNLLGEKNVGQCPDKNHSFLYISFFILQSTFGWNTCDMWISHDIFDRGTSTCTFAQSQISRKIQRWVFSSVYRYVKLRQFNFNL